MKYFITGSIMAVIVLAVGFISGDRDLMLNMIGFAAIVPLMLAGVFTGAFLGSDGVRNEARRYHDTETPENRKRKNKWATNLVLIALPNLVLLIVLLSFNDG
ncbi:MAG: hypothetical protein H0Z33_06485 [Bacillaceae bacterium]|nr:hypothetical protein [Bacillaceae bacterium]